jgi:hypothetical protein
MGFVSTGDLTLGHLQRIEDQFLQRCLLRLSLPGTSLMDISHRVGAGVECSRYGHNGRAQIEPAHRDGDMGQLSLVGAAKTQGIFAPHTKYLYWHYRDMMIRKPEETDVSARGEVAEHISSTSKIALWFSVVAQRQPRHLPHCAESMGLMNTWLHTRLAFAGSAVGDYRA